MKIDYDKNADVLYIEFRKALGKCEYVENKQGQIVRLDISTGEPVGCTIPLFLRRAEGGEIEIPEVGGAVGAGNA